MSAQGGGREGGALRKFAFEELCDHLPDAILAVGRDGVIERVNRQAPAMFQYGPSELLGGRVEMLVPERFRDQHRVHREKFLAAPVARPMGTTLPLFGMRKDGTEFPVEISLSPLDTGDRVTVLAVIRDIAGRRQTESALSESEQRYRLLVELLPEAVFVHSGGTILYANLAAARMFGAAGPADVQGKSFFSYLEPRDRERVRRRAESFGRDGKAIDSYEETFTDHDGRELHAELIVSAITYKGLPARQVVLRDVTQRKIAEEALRESEERYRSLVELSPEAIVVHTGGTILFANDAAAHLMRAESPSGLVGRDLEDFIPDEYRGQIFDYRKKLLYGEAGDEPLQLVIKAPDGRLTHIDVISAPMFHRGRVIVQSILRDVTVHRIAEAELRTSREQLRDLSTYLQTAREEERASIAREVHDELGQDMTALKMDLAWIEESLADAAPLPGESSIREKLKSMNGLIDQTIGTVRKIATQLRPVLLDSLGLLPAMEWQAEEFQNRTGILCRLVADPAGIEADKDRSIALFRIFQETLTNVARHAGATMVFVTLAEDERTISLAVRDNGKGIAPPDMVKARSFGLIGIRERALMFGGEVHIDGQPGHGTTVKVTIPL